VLDQLDWVIIVGNANEDDQAWIVVSQVPNVNRDCLAERDEQKPNLFGLDL